VQLKYLVMVVMATIQAHTPPHWFLGYRWSELAAIVAVIGFVAAGIVWLVKVAIINPQNVVNREQAKAAELSNKMLRESIDLLTKKVEGIGDNATQVHEKHDRRLDDHETRIQLNEHDIKELKGIIEK